MRTLLLSCLGSLCVLACNGQEPKGNAWEVWTGCQGSCLRGTVIHTDVSLGDLLELRALGANLVNLNAAGPYAELPPYEVDQEALADLDTYIGYTQEAGLGVVVQLRTGPGRDELAFRNSPDGNFQIWSDPTARQAWIDMWRFLADRYRDREHVVGYGLMVEPHPDTLADPEYQLTFEELRQAMQGTSLDWNLLAREITEEIRRVDPVTPIVVDSIGWADPAMFALLEPTGDNRTLYSFHGYSPHEYTHQDYQPGQPFAYSYPDSYEIWGTWVELNAQYLQTLVDPVDAFTGTFQAPVFVGEMGSMRWVPGAVGFNSDLLTLYESKGWSWCYYGWRGPAGWDGFNYELGTDPENHQPVPDNPLLQTYTGRWSANRHTFAP